MKVHRGLDAWIKNWGKQKILKLKDMKDVAKSLAKSLQGGDIVCLEAPIGGGKTTFVQMIGQELNIQEPITSPTFNLYEKYAINDTISLYHFDLYRIEHIKELDDLEFDDIWGSRDSISFIEWPERAAGRIPFPYLMVYFDFPPKNSSQSGKIQDVTFKSFYSTIDIQSRYFYAKIFSN